VDESRPGIAERAVTAMGESRLERTRFYSDGGVHQARNFENATKNLDP